MQNRFEKKYEDSNCADSGFGLQRSKSIDKWETSEHDFEIILDGNSDDELIFVKRNKQNQKKNTDMHRDRCDFKPTLLSPIPEEATEQFITSENDHKNRNSPVQDHGLFKVHKIIIEDEELDDGYLA